MRKGTTSNDAAVKGSARGATIKRSKSVAFTVENSDAEEETTSTKKQSTSCPSRSKKSKTTSDSDDEFMDDEMMDQDEIDLKLEKEEILKRLEMINEQLKGFEEDTKPTKTVKKAATRAKSVTASPKKAASPKKTIVGKGKGKKSASSASDSEDDDLLAANETCAALAVGTKSPSLLLAHKWDFEKGIDPTDYLISEKLDGVRAFWNGSEFLSREGNKFYAPDWFVKRFPKDMTLDGELFAGRGTFQEAVGIIRTKDQPKRWSYKIFYHVFDVPSMANKPFEERYQHLQDTFAKLKIKWVKVVEHTLCESKEHLLEELDKIQKLKGEGLMLRQPESYYEGKRSRTLLKVKTFLDADAKVIGHEKGSGKNSDVCGALRCVMLDGTKTEFKVGSGLSDKVRKNPPKIGSIIIYRYFELSKAGNPRFPSFVGERAD